MPSTINGLVQRFFLEVPVTWSAGIFFLAGTCVGGVLAWWIAVLTPERQESEASGRPRLHFWAMWRYWTPIVGYLAARRRRRADGERAIVWTVIVQLGTGVLFAVLVLATLRYGCLGVHEVRPPGTLFYWRLFHHLVFISLLVAATGTDLRAYVIPDEVTVTGLILAVTGATIAGHFQIIHLWVDWNREMPLKGPYIPDWIAAHPHWHGLAWSCAGAATGGGITWLVRSLSTFILGREALGFGDVTLMAMIGAFLGWQPVLLVFLIAPACGLIVGLLAMLTMNRPYVPYGPFLCAAAIVVLMTWTWLWTPTRIVFGHWPSLAVLGGVALAVLIGLLTLLRLYRLIPVKNRRYHK